MNGGASKRSNGFQRDLISALSCAWLWVGPLRGPSRHLAPKHVPTIPVGQDCSLSPTSRGSAWDKNRAAKPSRRPGETRIAPRKLPAAWERQESRRETFPPPGRDKNRAAKPSRRPGETRNVPRNLPAEWFGSGNSVSSLPPSGLGQETVFLASRRVIWVKKQCF